MFFKLNSPSALIFYFNDSKLETRQGKEKSLHYTTEVQFMLWMFSAIFGLVYRIHAAVGIVGKPCFAIADRGTFRL